MIIAIPAEKQSLDSGICVSFGRAPYFCVYDTDTQNSSFVVNSAAESEGGAGIKAAQNVLDLKVDSLITFRCGENAAKVLKTANISLLKALNLSIADNITNLLDGKLSELTDIHPGFHHGH